MPGVYTVTITDANITETVALTGTGISEMYGTSLSAYPNPVSDYLLVNFTTTIPGDITISLINSNGMVMNEMKVKAENETVQINVSDLSQGLYILKINGSGFDQSLRVIKK